MHIMDCSMCILYVLLNMKTSNYNRCPNFFSILDCIAHQLGHYCKYPKYRGTNYNAIILAITIKECFMARSVERQRVHILIRLPCAVHAGQS